MAGYKLPGKPRYPFSTFMLTLSHRVRTAFEYEGIFSYRAVLELDPRFARGIGDRGKRDVYERLTQAGLSPPMSWYPKERMKWVRWHKDRLKVAGG